MMSINNMIYTVTLNPAYDKTYTVSGFLPGGTNKVHSTSVKTGGKGLNVSRVLSGFGIPNLALGIADEIFCAAITREKIRHDFIITQSQVRTNIKISDEKHGIVTELNETGSNVSPEVFPKIEAKLEEYLKKGDIVIFTGSLPPGAPDDIYKKWIGLCHRKSVLSILDTSGIALKEGIEAKPYMIKPNLDELCYLAGRPLISISDIQSEALKIASSGIKKVLVSMGGDGAVLVSGNNVIT